MKLFKVSIDNNPGGWKSGADPSLLVIAKDKDEAIEKVRNGWGETWDFNNGNSIISYKKKSPDRYSIVDAKSVLSATEIRFDGYDIHIKTPRQAKLDRIDKHIKRNEI